MKNNIVKYIRELKPEFILNKKEQKCGFEIFQADFIGRDSKFYSVLVVYNESSYFTVNRESGLFPLSRCACLNQNTLVFESKEDWFQHRWKLNDIKNQIKYLGEFLQEVTFQQAPPNSKFAQVQVFFSPVLATNLVYELEGVLHSELFTEKKLLNLGMNGDEI